MSYVYLKGKINLEKVDEPPGFVIEGTRKAMPENFGGLSDRLNYSLIKGFSPKEDEGGLIIFDWTKVMVRITSW